MNTKLILVRHGQSQWNLENRFTGSKDIPLTEQGMLEAKSVGMRLKTHKIDLAFTSQLMRAQHTLRLMLMEMGQTEVPIIKDAALNERSYGELEGMNKDLITKQYGAKQVYQWRRSFTQAAPMGESLKDTYDRVLAYFEKAIKPALLLQKNVLIVAHGNSLRALVMYLENLSPAAIIEREIATGAALIYNFDKQIRRIQP